MTPLREPLRQTILRPESPMAPLTTGTVSTSFPESENTKASSMQRQTLVFGHGRKSNPAREPSTLPSKHFNPSTMRSPAMKRFLVPFCVVCALFLLTRNAWATEYPELMFILDASGSMWGKAGDTTKIEAAREVFSKVVPSIPQEVKTGLTAYGHRRKNDCKDIEILIPPGSNDRPKLLSFVNSISPKGMTPLADSVKLVAEQLRTKEAETIIVLVSDGKDTCNPDPCSVIRTLKDTGIQFVLHVVGFGVDDRGRQQLSCLAQAGGGSYFNAAGTAELLASLENINKQVEVKVEQAKTTTKTATTKLGQLKLTMPPQSAQSLARVKFVRKGDSKLVKDVVNPTGSSTHTLLFDDYEVILGFANANYYPDTDVSLGVYKVMGGETTTISLGAIGFNIAPSLEKNPTSSVILVDEKTGKEYVTLEGHGNSYYLFRSKPVPPGSYSLELHFARSAEPSTFARNILVEAGKETAVTIDSGFKLKQPKGIKINGWDLLPAKEGAGAGIKARRRWDNDYPLREVFPVMPGTYNLTLQVDGMSEPMPAAEGIVVNEGDLVEFDTGL